MGISKGLLVSVILVMLAMTAVMAAPTGPDTMNVVNSTRATESSTPGQLEAMAGNVTELNITATQVTKFWQGYYGNVSGAIVLSNSANQSLYRWSLAQMAGEVYSSRNESINWSNIRCANDTEIFDEDLWVGANSTSHPDSVNRTFSSNTFSSFYTGISNFTTGSCRSAAVNASAGDKFYEVLQMDRWNDTGINSFPKFIYTAILADDTTGFDGRAHDFQMLVSEPGSGAEEYPSGTATTYYFWVELG